MSTRILLPALAVVVAVGALAGGALLWLGGDEPPPISVGDPGGGDPETQVDAPSVAPISQREHTAAKHDLPWPFAEFGEDIAALKRPARNEVFMRRDALEDELGRNLLVPRVTLRLENATPEDVIAELTREFAKHDLNVYTRDPPVDNDPVFERFYLSDADVFEVIESLRVRTHDLVTYAITPAGLCIGSKKACIDARAAASAWEEEQVGAGAPDEAFAFLEGVYRPDFRDAHIGAVIRDIHEQCGAEVVVDPDVWGTPVRLTWSADPMPVLAALRQIAIKCGGTLYAKDGRVFLLDV